MHSAVTTIWRKCFGNAWGYLHIAVRTKKGALNLVDKLVKDCADWPSSAFGDFQGGDVVVAEFKALSILAPFLLYKKGSQQHDIQQLLQDRFCPDDSLYYVNLRNILINSGSRIPSDEEMKQYGTEYLVMTYRIKTGGEMREGRQAEKGSTHDPINTNPAQ